MPPPPPPSVSERAALDSLWRRHLAQQGRAIFLKAGIALSVTLFLGFVLDSLFMTDAHSLEVSRVNVPLQAAVCLLATILLAFWPRAAERPMLIAGVFGPILSALCGYSLGALGGMDGPYFYVAYLFTAVGLGVPADLPMRILFALGLIGAFLFAFFGFHPEHLGAPNAHVAYLHLSFMTVALLYFGHLQHRRAYELFALQNRERARAATLAEEVEVRANDLRAVTQQVEHVRTAERQDIAREIHDDFGQLLLGARLAVEEIAREDDAGLAPAVERLRGILDAMRKSTRQVVGGLRTEDAVPFEIAVDDIVEAFRAMKRVEIDLRLECAEHEPEGDTRAAALRVLQESLTNVIRHASARRIEVRVALVGAGLEVRVLDDGIGLNSEARGSGFGLTGMRERVQACGGELRVEAREGGGTSVHARFPLRGLPAAVGE